ncbi:MAG TPA: DUF2252 domain-containing protein [Polyangiaceae bacterium]|nr:DUF2252 domain-containing protein [Polyangiaceae bacterium]HTY17134.1 DUF2252 domain-containing protein [Myxococcota bacterium]
MSLSAAAQAPRRSAQAPTLAQRRAQGRALRDRISRQAHGTWEADANREDPVELLRRVERNRIPTLLPIKHGRMAESPFGFFRGAAPVMAADLATLPRTPLAVQICGDAHVRNLGAFAAPDGHLVFDINDFDETTRGPWEWDLKRLAASFVLAGREAGARDRECLEAVADLSRTYRRGLARFSEMPYLELARHEVRSHARAIHETLKKARRATPLEVLEKLTVRGRNGVPRIAQQPPLLTRLPMGLARQVTRALASYRQTLSADRQHVLDAYRPADFGFKVVGTGSVGSRDYVVLGLGFGASDPLFLQVKEEFASAYAPYLRADPEHDGQRVALGQRRMQTWSDPLLGWTTLGGRPFLVRQLADHKASIEPDELSGPALLQYAAVCGEIFAKAHARTGDAAAIAGYCGRGDRFDRALVRFALAYADQTTADHERYLRAIRSGRLRARRGI